MDHVFECLAVLDPTDKEQKDGRRSRIILAAQVVLAKDENEVRQRAARLLPAEYEDQLYRVRILVRPFASRS